MNHIRELSAHEETRGLTFMREFSLSVMPLNTVIPEWVIGNPS
ncbi:hypothetical protein ACU6TU_15410 [Halomonas sp. LS-001]